MKNYIFVSSSLNGNDTTAISIVANDELMALSKAYSYFGGDSRLQIEDFNILVTHTPIQRIYRLFKDFTGQTILYFAEKKEECLIDDLYEVDIIKCQ